MKLKVTYELDTREGVAELLAVTKHLELMPLVTGSEKTYENRAELADCLGWADIAVTFAQNRGKDGYDVEVQDNDGIIVKTFMHLHEWTGYATPFINEQDAMGLINYMIGLNTTAEGMRDGTTIR
jgi:hypothetical protein